MENDESGPQSVGTSGDEDRTDSGCADHATEDREQNGDGTQNQVRD